MFYLLILLYFCHNSATWCSALFLIGEVLGAVWSPVVVSSALHSNCLKGEQIKEQMHNWIYITHLDEIFIFWFLMKNAGLLQRSVCVCVCLRPRCSRRQLGGCAIRTSRCGSQYRSLTPGPPAGSQVDNITLHRPHYSATLKSPAADWPTESATLTTAPISLGGDSFLLMPSGAFTRCWPHTEDLICCKDFDLFSEKKTHTGGRTCHLYSVQQSLQHKHVIC